MVNVWLQNDENMSVRVGGGGWGVRKTREVIYDAVETEAVRES